MSFAAQSALRLSRHAVTNVRSNVFARRLTSSSVLREGAPKPSIGNIAEIRKLLPGTSMVKAKEALTASANNVTDALAWLENDLQVSGAKKASKVSDRVAKEGGVGICIVADGAPPPSSGNLSPVTPLSARAGIVELNCETDFVGRNEIFQQLLADLAHTVALFPTLAMDDGNGGGGGEGSASQSQAQEQGMIDVPLDQLLGFPLIARPTNGDATSNATTSPKTVGAAIVDVITRLGERVHLARASSLSNASVPSYDASSTSRPSTPWVVASAFAHGSAAATGQPTQGPQVFVGRVGSLLLTRIQRPENDARRRDEASLKALRGLTRSLARQAAGMPTQSIVGDAAGQAEEGAVLYEQPFLMRLPASNLPGYAAEGEETVQQALQSWGSEWVGQSKRAEGEPVRVLEMRRWQLGESV